VTTLIVSDLHLGARSGRDLLRQEPVRAALCDALRDMDELVLLGDVLELREAPLAQVLATARPVLEGIDRAMAGRRVTLLAGNHDHQTAGPLLEGLRLAGRPLDPVTIGQPAAWIADFFRHSDLRAAYPGVWVRDDVYATHGHYLDVHNTVPTFERIAIGAVQRVTARVPDGRARAADYEAALAPVYSLLYSLAQSAPNGLRSDRSSRVWQAIDASQSRGRALVTGAAIRTAVGALNLAGVGPLRPELSGEALRDSALTAMETVVERLGIDAPHVVFGHTHRSGPHPRDASWGRLLNPGSWILEAAFLGERPLESPYFPGHCVVVPDEGPPRLRRLLDQLPIGT
jgi:predicted phosphodiesterase